MANDTEPASLPSSLEAVGFLRDVWGDLRPYLKHLIVDFCISAGLWIALYLFDLLTRLCEIKGWAGEFIVTVHAVGTVLAFIAFGLLFAIDVLALRAAERKRRTTS